MLDEDRDLIKRCLHGTLRHEYQRNINKHVRLSEESRKQGRWRAVLNSLLGHLAGKKRQKGVDLNILERHTVDIIGDQVEAHKELTGEFTKYFKGSKWWRGRLHEGDYFDRHSESDAAFLQVTNYTGVPDELRRLIYRAIRQVSKP